MLTPIALGFGTGISMIVAIGAQNAFVLRQGLRREHVLPVVVFVSCADVVLVGSAIAGVGAVVARVPVVLDVARVLGVVYLLGYAALALHRAVRRPGALHATAGEAPASLRVVLSTCAAMTLLNPHLYLDVLMLGSIANSHPGGTRWLFGLGIVTASVVWFTALGGAATRLAGVFARPVAWRVLDVAVAAGMVVVAVSLASGIGNPVTP